MPDMRGTVTVVQESRFQLTDRHGASHLFTLSPKAAAEPAQLADLAARQAQVRVRYAEGGSTLSWVAEAIVVEPAQGRRP